MDSAFQDHLAGMFSLGEGEVADHKTEVTRLKHRQYTVLYTLSKLKVSQTSATSSSAGVALESSLLLWCFLCITGDRKNNSSKELKQGSTTLSKGGAYVKIQPPRRNFFLQQEKS